MTVTLGKGGRTRSTFTRCPMSSWQSQCQWSELCRPSSNLTTPGLWCTYSRSMNHHISSVLQMLFWRCDWSTETVSLLWSLISMIASLYWQESWGSDAVSLATTLKCFKFFTLDCLLWSNACVHFLSSLNVQLIIPNHNACRSLAHCDHQSVNVDINTTTSINH